MLLVLVYFSSSTIKLNKKTLAKFKYSVDNLVSFVSNKAIKAFYKR